jgi:uracil-DNA glycosylase
MMQRKEEFSTPDLLRMAKEHVESLRAAGVEWIALGDASSPKAVGASEAPKSPPPEAARGGRPHAEASESALVGRPGLFDQPVAAPAMSSEEKRKALQELNEKHVVGCPRCPVLVRNRTQTVFGVGNPDAALVFVGEAPGADEDAQGEPFVGAAGRLLNRIIEACAMKREDVYICNILKCRPPGNRTPLPDEIANCFPYLEQQLAIIRPKFLCALGAVAAQALLGTTQSIGKLRGRFHSYQGIPVLCTYHPAYLLRSPEKKREVWEDMKMLLARMGRPVTG